MALLKQRLLEFLATLRAAGLSVTTAEALDAARALAIVGIEFGPFREGLAACVVKDQADRPRYDEVFDRFFAAPQRERKSPRKTAESEGVGAGGGKRGSGRSPSLPERELPNEPRPGSGLPSERSPSRAAELPRRVEHPALKSPATEQLGRDKGVLRTRFSEMTPEATERCQLLAEALARHVWAHRSRRSRIAQRGVLDIRRTLRRAAGHGGVPLQIISKRPRPRKLDLVALCDLSYSVASASSFLLSLLQPAPRYFRRVHLFGYVDRAIDIELVGGTIRPQETIDYYARSDFGRVLESFYPTYRHLLTRNSVLLVLGDARNNRRPARSDIFREVRRLIRRTAWLNPEPPDRWNTGDSAIAHYTRDCDVVLAADTPGDLLRSLRSQVR